MTLRVTSARTCPDSVDQVTSLADILQAIAAGVVAILAAISGISAFTRRKARLRSAVEANLKILRDMPEGSHVREDLAQLIDQQVRYLIAEEEPFTTKERRSLRQGLILLAASVLFAAISALLLPGPYRTFGWVVLVCATVLSVIGVVLSFRGLDPQYKRQLANSHAADPAGSGDPKAAESADTSGSSTEIVK